ncbi:MAG: hypothetical protein ACI4AD_03150 [Roseburia sp.]
MENEKMKRLKNKFAELFAEYDKKLGQAKTDVEIEQIRIQIIEEQRQKIRENLKAEGKEHFLREDEQDGLAIQLRPEEYKELVDAKGGDIETKIILLLDEFARMKDLKDGDAELLVYMLAEAGMLAVTCYVIKALFDKICGCAAEEMTAVLLEGVETIGVCNIVSVIVCVVIDLLIPLLYFVQKPAVCVLLLINELHQDLVFVEESCVHGKRTEVTKIIPKVGAGKTGNFYSAGLFSSQKKKDALIGTQYGFVLKQEDIDKIKFSFGIGCPLSSGKNNCAVGFDQTAESIAKDADKYQRQEDVRTNRGYKLEIRCNSAKGSIAYYIGRVTYE